ncbi:Trimethyllysine dioxygenase [Rozella allomycis CSF55]|uniref:Trimethyllysine dioxygenase n=1 Tax=Rozella allomycis (strain CSF55) TaxID=988480 RepID=A0A4P9YID5_ROZAC|nr:Trimethyllysine dioxygenase [Rozella allomycis CSF55]
MQRLVDTYTIPLDINARSLDYSRGKITIHWSDNHRSIFPENYLINNSYDPKLNDETNSNKKMLWNSKDIRKIHPKVEFKQVMSDDKILLQWLENIEKYGICFVKNVPPNAKDSEALARRISFIRETHYGKYWDFTANLEHGDTAYTTIGLGAHTDTTYFTEPIGLQMFHLLEFQGIGGKSLFVDGFRVAEELKRHQPEAFEILTKIKLSHQYVGDENAKFKSHGNPIIRLDEHDKLYQIRFNNNDRTFLSKPNAKNIEDFYFALNEWNKPGTVVIFDNWRVLHGRNEYVGHRRLSGCYINRDDYISRLTTLREKYSKK